MRTLLAAIPLALAACAWSLAPEDPLPPSAPVHLTASPVSPRAIAVAWSLSGDEAGVAGVQLHRDGHRPEEVFGGAHLDVGLAPGSRHCYVIVAYDAAGNRSAPSSEVCATTHDAGTPLHALTARLEGEGAGAVVGPGLACGPDCSEHVARGVTVTVRASAAGGSSFAGWSGCDATAGPACTVSMESSRTVTARFEPGVHTLTVAVENPPDGRFLGGGAVVGPGIACPGDCSEPFADGAPLTLAARPAILAALGGWAGCDDTGPPGTCTLRMVTSRRVGATFHRTALVVVEEDGTGAGTITGPGISCGEDCSERYLLDARPELSAEAAPGSTFTGWSGCTGASGSTCQLTLDGEARTVTATFQAVPRS